MRLYQVTYALYDGLELQTVDRTLASADTAQDAALKAKQVLRGRHPKRLIIVIDCTEVASRAA